MTNRQWPQPEQDGPAYRTWSNIVENTTYKQQDLNRAIFGGPLEDYIPLDAEANNDDLLNRGGGKDVKQLKRKLPGNERGYTNGYNTSNGRACSNTESECTYAPWKSRDYSQDSIGLNEEIQDFLSYIKPRPEEDAIRRNVVDRVEAVIKDLWPQAEVELYGSCQTGLYLPTSDIDLVVHGKWQALPLRTLENALLEKEIADANSIRVLDKASVPIIKVTDKKTEVKVDISFNMKTGVQSADMIKNYIKQYPALPYLTFVLKQFLLNRDLNEVFTGGLSSYTVVLMIVSYFQHSGHFAGPETNLGVLLIGFFELYGRKFNYNNVGIRVVDSGSYFNKEQILGNLLNSIHLCIEDPLTEGNFIGKSSFRINDVKRTFERACSELTSAVLNKIPGNQSCSILARITRIPKETVEQRERTLKLFLETSPIPTMPSYASVATRNTCTTTIRSINGVKTIDLHVTRPSETSWQTYGAGTSTSQAQNGQDSIGQKWTGGPNAQIDSTGQTWTSTGQNTHNSTGQTWTSTGQTSHDWKTKDERNSRTNQEKLSPPEKTALRSLERTKQHIKEKNHETNGGGNSSRPHRDRSFKERSSSKGYRNHSTDRTSPRRDNVHVEKHHQQQRQLLSQNHKPSKRSQMTSPSSSTSSSITETCAMRSTKGGGPSLKEVRSQTERLFC